MNLKQYIPDNIKTMLKMSDATLVTGINRIIHSDFCCNANTKRCFDNIKSPNYKYEYFGKDTPSCCATNLYTILKNVTQVLEDNHLEYFISYGTLLGSVRHGGLIPWDTDIDLIIAEKEKEKIFKILKNAFKEEPYVVKEDYDEKNIGSLFRVNLSSKNSLHIDFFSYIEKENTIIFGYNSVFSKEEIYPLKKISFYELRVYAPHNTHAHLHTLYGDEYMKYAYKQWASNKKKFKIQNYNPAKILT